MARTEWLGQALAVAQVDHFTPALVGIGDTFSVTINGRSVSYSAAVATAADVCDGLQPLLAASEYPEFKEITWTEDNTKIIGTSKVAGRPFTATCTASGGVATFTRSASVASSGPNDWSVASNWSEGSIPNTADEAIIYPGRPDILYGLDQSATGALSSIVWLQNSSVKLGLPSRNPSGYAEYRPTHLKIPVFVVYVGYQNTENRSGVTRFKLNSLTNACVLYVNYTGQPDKVDIAAVDYVGNNALNKAYVLSGSVSIGVNGQTKLAALQVSDTGVRANTRVIVGSRVDQFDTLTQTGGEVTALFNPDTWSQTGGMAVVNATNTITDLSLANCLLYVDAAPTITSAWLNTRSTINTSRVTIGPTITDTTAFGSSAIDDNNGAITFTNPILLSGCSLVDVRFNLGQGRHIAVS